MKWIKYQYVCNSDSNIILTKRIGYSLANISLARKEALNGSFSIEEDDKVYEKEPLPIEFGGTGQKTIEGILNAFGIKDDYFYKESCPVQEIGSSYDLYPPSYWANMGGGVFEVEHCVRCGLGPIQDSGVLLNMFSASEGTISQIFTSKIGNIYFRSGDLVEDEWANSNFKDLTPSMSDFSYDGSYSGTGWGDSNHPTSVSTPFRPRWIMVINSYGFLFGIRTGSKAGIGYGLCRTTKSAVFIGHNVFTFEDDKVSWYVDNVISDGNIPGCQSNMSGVTYYWVAGI